LLLFQFTRCLIYLLGGSLVLPREDVVVVVVAVAVVADFAVVVTASIIQHGPDGSVLALTCGTFVLLLLLDGGSCGS
jgi:hypothetical protein